MGTHFDVNAYKDESVMKTTLLEGSVKVSKGKSALMLVPGQQAQIKDDGSITLNKNADTEAAVSWTRGYFHFNDASMEDVLRQLARWYDVEIVYEKHYPEETFGGDIQKSLTLAQVLKLLDKSQVKFRIQGKQLIVMK
jgi:ferric-dicitrate binding protein FerR (iron transport regulator)